MANILKQLKAFMAFDLPVNYDSIRELFLQIHTSYREDYPGWSTRATRRKAISVYWYKLESVRYTYFINISSNSAFVRIFNFLNFFSSVAFSESIFLSPEVMNPAEV
jgi:hypothetical protein